MKILNNFFLLTFLLLFVNMAFAVKPEFQNVSEANYFIEQSGIVNLSFDVFQNENCLRFLNITIPSDYDFWIPPSANIEIGRIFAYDPSNSLLWQGRVMTTINPNLLAYFNDSTQIGEIAIAGSVLRFNFYEGNNPACLQPSTLKNVVSFNRGILTNPPTQGSYSWDGKSELSNDPIIYSSGNPFVIIYNYLTYYQTEQNITNWDFQCSLTDNETIVLNATNLNNNNWTFALDVLQNNTNLCQYNITQVNNNDNICQVNTSVDVPDVYVNGSFQVCNGTTWVNFSDNTVYNQTFLADLLLNNTNLFVLNQSLNYTCSPRVENYFNWTMPNGTNFSYNYLVQNNLSLSGFVCPACTCNCNPPSCPSDNIINQYNFSVLPQIANTIEEHQGAFWFIGAVFLLGLATLVFFRLWKKEEVKPGKKKDPPKQKDEVELELEGES